MIRMEGNDLELVEQTRAGDPNAALYWQTYAQYKRCRQSAAIEGLED